MALTLKFEVNGKTKILDVPIVYGIASNTNGGQFDSEANYKGSFQSLFEFLELPRSVQTLTGKLNGKPVNYIIEKNNLPASNNPNDEYMVTIKNPNNSQNYYIRAREQVETIKQSDNNSGMCIAYSYRYEKWVVREGPQSFSPQQSAQVLPFKAYWDTKLVGNGILQPNSKNLIANELYRAVYSHDNYNVPIGYGYFTSKLYTSDNITNFFKNLEINVPTYPGDDDQPEDDAPMPGDGDDDSDPIPKPPLPTWDVTSTGFVVIYNPNVIQIGQLAYFMWSGDFADLIKKVFREPFQALISLKMLFCPIVSGPEQTVWLGNVETDVSMPKVTQQFVDVDMGTIQINEYFGSFADYEPYTRIQIFLPFIGYKELNTDEVMNSTLSLSYRVDVYSGACVAFLKITKTINGTPLDAILYQFDGNCAMEIPFTSNDNSRYIAAILNSASSASMAVANTSNFTPSQQPTQWTKGEKASLTIGSLAPVANGLIDIMATKPNVQRAGALAGAVAALGVKQPYIIIHRPIKHMPSNYSHYLGIPSNLAKKLSAVTGYTIVSQIFMSSAVATENEITMITEILKSGVII